MQSFFDRLLQCLITEPAFSTFNTHGKGGLFFLYPAGFPVGFGISRIEFLYPAQTLENGGIYCVCSSGAGLFAVRVLSSVADIRQSECQCQ